ncbi:MAG: ComEC/Rec2 family competence protein [Candidatus Daviesbacteria bacterium]|nr:ComEC/Rec2 family competence protein [Candidatus Daviesbacteria bacterium]
MSKLLVFFIPIWLILLTFRIISIGGVDPTYRHQEVEYLSPLKEVFTERANQILPSPQSELLAGIVLGEDKIPYWLKKDLQRTSTIHLVVVSGQNLSLLAGFLMGLVYFLGRRLTILIIFLIIPIYAVLTGFQVPVIRAQVMIYLVFGAQLLGRDQRGIWSLILAGSLMLLLVPHWIFSISFQLSFMATLGVVLSDNLLPAFRRVPRIIREDLVVTISATALTMPLIAYYFGELSLIGILVNILILWCIPLIMISGAIILIISLVSLTLAQVLAVIPGILLTYFLYIVDFFSDLPFASLNLGESPLITWIGYYLILFSLFRVLNLKWRLKDNQENLGRQLC